VPQDGLFSVVRFVFGLFFIVFGMWQNAFDPQECMVWADCGCGVMQKFTKKPHLKPGGK
jgi:hypothetical protein